MSELNPVLLYELGEAAALLQEEHPKLAEAIVEAVNLLTAREWISVGERLPESGVTVLRRNAGYRAPKPYTDVDTIDKYSPLPPNEVTHWMPLPPPPAADK